MAGITPDSQVIITVPRAVKGAWVAASRAQGRKLTDWIIDQIDGVPDVEGFTLGIEAFKPFEAYVLALSGDDARSILRRVRILDSRQEDAVASVKIVAAYLEKRVAIAEGIADREMFADINSRSFEYVGIAEGLTHEDLIGVIAQS